MNCLDCQTANYEAAVNCIQCGQSMRPARANRYLDYAEDCANKGQYAQARAHIVHADAEMLTLNPADRDRYLLAARAFWLQGVMYYSSGAMSDAEQELLLAKSKLEDNPNGKALLAEVLNKLGNIGYYEEDFEKAIAYYEQSSALAEQVGAYEVGAKATTNIGNIYISRNEVAKAELYLHRGAAQAELAGNTESLAGVYRTLAWLYSNYGSATRAVEFAAKTLEVAAQISSLEARCMAIAEAAGAYARCGDLERAAYYLRDAYELVRSTGDHVAEATVATNLAELVRQKQDSSQWYVQALKEMNSYNGSIPWSKERAYYLALYYVVQNNRSQMRLHLQWIKDNAAQAHLSGVLISRAKATIYTAIGEYDEAETCFIQALDEASIPYDIATITREYANMLLQHAETTAKPELFSHACTLLTEAADIYRRMEMKRHALPIEATVRVLQRLERTEQ